MFRLPQKQLIVNSATQLRVLKYDGSATYIDIVSPALATDGFFLEGFLQPLLFGSLKAVVSTTLIKAVAGAAGSAQVATWVINAVTGGDASGEDFQLVYQHLKLSPVENQNQPLMKHYQVSATLGSNPTAVNTAIAIAAAINADKNCPVTVSRSSATLTFTAKEAGVAFTLYNKAPVRGGLITAAFTVTTVPTLDIGTYDDLKNINWSKNVDFDRNAEFFPVYGQTYKSYRFIIKSTPFMPSGNNVASEAPRANSAESEVRLWIANGLTLQTTMDLVVADANAAT